MLGVPRTVRALLVGLLSIVFASSDAVACAPAGAACGPAEDACCAGLLCADPAAGGTCVNPVGAGEPCSPAVPCAGGLFCQPSTQRCIVLRTVGEGCADDAPCMAGLICEPCLTDACIAPSQCFPDPRAGAIGPERCLALYSPPLHDAAAAGGMATTYGAGSAVGDGGAAWQTAGVVYGPDDRYGCFTMMCSGPDDAALAPFVSLGSYGTYDAVRGSTLASVESAAIPGLVSFSRSLVFARNPDAADAGPFLGTWSAVAAGVSPDLHLVPIRAGDHVCETVLETVVGNAPPVVMCTDVTACASPSECTAAASVARELFDPEDDMIGLVQEPAGPFGIGRHRVTLTAIDPEMAIGECAATVTVNDCAPPEITCPAATVAECQSGGQAVVDPGAASVRDCSPVTLSDPGSASYPMGTTPVLYSAADTAGNRASCEAHVTVVDTTPPVIVCPTPSTAECTANEQAWVDPGDAVATDCNPISVTDPGPASYRLGTTRVAYTATDSAGMSSSCTALVTVRDTRAPAITCPADVVAECQGFERAEVDPGDAVATDACSGVTVTEPGAGVYSLGATPVSYTATDATGNSATCAMTVFVVDTLPPAIWCPAPTTVECAGQGQAIVDPGDAVVSDCTPTAASDPGPASYRLGDTAVTYVATDSGGRSSTCETVVTVEDTTPPAITCPAEVVVECEGAGGTWVDPGDAAAADACTDTTVSDPGPGMYAFGATGVTYWAADAAANSASCETAVHVVDTLPPAIGRVSAVPDRLWPPNHEMQTVTVEVAATDVCDAAVSCSVVGVASNEPEDGLGDGDTPYDVEIVDAGTVRLRAERSGPGAGRVYTITVECADGTRGNTTRATATVVVAHDQR